MRVRSAALAVLLAIAFPLEARAQILDTILSKINSALDAAKGARAAAEEMRTNLRAGIADLTGDLKSMIDDAIEDAKSSIKDERDGREAFLPGGQCAAACSAFRADLIDTLNSVRDLSSEVFEAADLSAQADLSPLITVIQSAPGRMLYPLHRVSSRLIGPGLVSRLHATVANLQLLREVEQGASRKPAGSRGPLEAPDVCAAMLAKAEGVEVAATGVTVTSAVLRITGKIFDAMGETRITGTGATWGWVGATIEENKRKKIGNLLEGVSEGLARIADHSREKLMYCTLLDAREQTRTSLAAITAKLDTLTNPPNLDVPVSTRASQTSVDAIGADVKTLLGLGGGGGSMGNGLVLRTQIERGLADDGLVLSVFYLPESFGGLLDLVRDIVADSITQNLAAGREVKNAALFLERGDAAKAESHFREAYDLYQTAYLRSTSQRAQKQQK
jgi:hypothetical protein